MTSFKSAQLIANSKDADKVIFLMDRIELGTQSLKEYRAFAEENESVQATEDTGVLITKQRIEKAEALRAMGKNPYTSVSKRDTDTANFIEKNQYIFNLEEGNKKSG